MRTNTLYKWISLFKEHQEAAFPGSGYLRPEGKGTRHLLKRITDLEEENAILKRLRPSS